MITRHLLMALAVVMASVSSSCRSTEVCDRWADRPYTTSGQPQFNSAGIKNVVVLVSDPNIAAVMTEKLVKYSRYNILERTSIDNILKERGIQILNDPAKAAEVATGVGADAIILGDIHPVDRHYSRLIFGGSLRFVRTSPESILWSENYPKYQQPRQRFGSDIVGPDIDSINEITWHFVGQIAPYQVTQVERECVYWKKKYKLFGVKL